VNINNISLNYYSFGYYGGLISGSGYTEPSLNLNTLTDLAKKYGLGGIEIPFDRFFNINQIEEGIKTIKKIQQNNLSVFIDLENFDIKYINNLVPKLRSMGMTAIRIKMDQIGSTIYGGNRYLSPTFQTSVDNFKINIEKLLPTLDKYDVALAIENHQDFHSLELVDIANNFDPALVGITWDVGNSIAVADTIDTFYTNAGHLIKNVHLKDYKVFNSNNGIRLVRCPLGEGIVDYKDLFNKLSSHNVNMSIELGAQTTRECNINELDYWEHFSNIDLNKKEYLEFIDKIALTSLKSFSNYEDGLRGRKLIDNELNEFKISVQNFNKIFLEMNCDN
jgi:sugar phosphate isomerase/epimerase